MQRRLALIFVFSFLAIAVYATPPKIPDAFWNSLFCVRDGIDDFGGSTVASMFRDVSFVTVTALDGTTTTFSITPKSLDGNEVILEYTQSRSTGEQKQYYFHFIYKGTYSLLYKFSGMNESVEGFDQMVAVMYQGYLPALKK